MRITLISALLITSVACGDEPRRPIGGTCGGDSECESGLCLYGQCLDPAADEDLDGVINGIEGSLDSNPNNRDTDYDGVLDGDELDGASSRDTDGDGMADILESRVDDKDSDCLPDELDADDTAAATDLQPAAALLCATTGVCRDFPGGIRVTCGDDKKPICDFSEIAQFQADEATCDGLDNDCDGRSDEGAPDLDGDGSANCVDIDLDGDQANNDADNCPEIANQTQDDADADGAGDICDVPASPVLTGFAPTSPTNLVTVTAYGEGETLSTVTLYSDSKCLEALGSGDVGADGSWSASIELTAGPQSFWLRAVNRAGLSSACSKAELTFEVDQTPPSSPSVTGFEPVSWGRDVVRYAISGAADAGGALQMYTDAECKNAIGDAVTVVDGRFEFELDIQKGTNIVYATVTDLAGNTSACVEVAPVFGMIEVEAFNPLGPADEIAVQFHYPDGSMAGPPLWTDPDGFVSLEGFNGFGVTVLTRYSPSYVEYASVLGVEPGRPTQFEISFFGIFEDSTAYFTLDFPPVPEGTAWIKVLAPCGYHYLGAENGTTAGRLGIGATCFGDQPSFDIALLAMGDGTEPLGYLVKTNVPATSGDITFDGNWTRDGLVKHLATVTTGSVGGEYTFTSSWFSKGARLEGEDSSRDQAFAPANSETELSLLMPPVPAMTAHWVVKTPHLGGNGAGLVGSSGMTSELPLAFVFDVEKDFLPKIYDFSLETVPGNPLPTRFRWTADQGLDRADALRFSATFWGMESTVRWMFVTKPNRRQEVGAPQLSGEFPGSWLLKTIYYVFPDRIEARDSAETRGLHESLEQCPAGIECGHEAYGDSDFSSCCDGDGGTER